MIDLSQVQNFSKFSELVSTPFRGEINAMCFKRELVGDFSEIISKVELEGNITELDEGLLSELNLSQEGQIARDILLHDLQLLTSHGAAPVLNIIKYYERDDTHSVFPTDVYSFHIDRSPVPTDTFLCTYYGEASEILPNAKAIQKVLIPEIREELKKLYGEGEEGFDAFLSENFFDLHYERLGNVQPINLGLGHIWRLAIDHPDSKVPPCVHRAPLEKNGEPRLLLIC